MNGNARIPLDLYSPKERPSMKFKLKRRLTLRGWRWFWAIVGRNGEIMASSEGIVNRGDAMASIRVVMREARGAIVESEPEQKP
jgi:uncharacterized protein YegP (UPF0339 family)